MDIRLHNGRMWRFGASRLITRRADGKAGWKVRTTLGNDGLLSVEVLSEGGSDYIRNKVLRAALQREQDLIAKRVKEHESSAPDVTSCGEPQPDESGLLRVAIGNTGRKDDGIVIGHMFLQPATGDLVRVAGRLSKNPSFWISQVDVEWNYARIGKDNVLPVSLYLDRQGEDVRRLDVPHDLRLSQRRWSDRFRTDHAPRDSLSKPKRV